VIINELSKPLAFFISIIFHLRNLSNIRKIFETRTFRRDYFPSRKKLHARSEYFKLKGFLF